MSDDMWAIAGGSAGGLFLIGIILAGLYFYRKRKVEKQEQGAAVSKAISIQMSDDPERATLSPKSPDGNPMTVPPLPPRPISRNVINELRQRQIDNKKEEEEGTITSQRSNKKDDIVLPDSRHTSITSRQAEEEKADQV